MARALHPVDPAEDPHLSGRFAPIDVELDVQELEVEGEVPTDITGMYLRNGPNPQFTPLGSYTYPMEGDAMLHGVWLENGRARYRNRFVRTQGFRSEAAVGHALYGGLMTPAFVDQSLLGDDPDPGWPFRLDPFINVLRHGDGYLALGEGVPPYRVTGELETVGRFDFGGVLAAGTSAHPKVDPVTGELVTFCYGVEEPYLTWTMIGADGTVIRPPSPVEGVDESYMIHDFAITARYVVFVLGPVTLDINAMLAGGQVLKWKPELGTRIGLVDRAGAAPTRWFDNEAFWVWHVANAHDDAENVVVDFPQWSAPGLGLAEDEAVSGRFVRITLDCTSGRASTAVVDERPSEFPRVDDRLVGGAYRYAVAAASSGRSDLTPGEHDVLIRRDLIDGAQVSVVTDAAVGEAAFVPRDGATEELDGYYAAFGTSLVDGRSGLYLWDAADLTPTPRARVIVPQRVPNGLHGNWFSAGVADGP